MNYKNVRKRWDLDVWMDRIEIIENQIMSIAKGKKVANDIENVFIRNYAKLSLCLREVLTLLDNGYPDGALTIARTVYEITIITEFLYSNYKKGKNTELLERYFEDQNVKAYRNLKKLYEDISKIPNVPPEWKTKVDELSIKQKEIQSKYGNTKGEYWWANEALKVRNTTFAMIDNFVNDDFLLRMLYKRACISIHASSMNSFALLGRENEEGNIIYTTQTDKGFESPLLLGMFSHDRFADVICDYLGLIKNEVLNDMNDTYKIYIKDVLH